MNIEQKTTIKPSVDLASGRISIEMFDHEPPLFDARDAIKRHQIQVVETRDKAVRDALIALGWRPPEDLPVVDVRHRVRAQDAGTSVDAAERASKFAGSHQRAILTALIGAQLTVRELGKLIGISHVSVARRMPELERASLVCVVATPGGDDLVRDGCRVWRRVAEPT